MVCTDHVERVAQTHIRFRRGRENPCQVPSQCAYRWVVVIGMCTDRPRTFVACVSATSAGAGLASDTSMRG